MFNTDPRKKNPPVPRYSLGITDGKPYGDGITDGHEYDGLTDGHGLTDGQGITDGGGDW
jgi:hypothetical protein